MTTEKPNVTPTGVYNITQTAKALQVSYSTVRVYRERGYLPVYNRAGRPVVKGKDILKLWEAFTAY